MLVNLKEWQVKDILTSTGFSNRAAVLLVNFLRECEEDGTRIDVNLGDLHQYCTEYNREDFFYDFCDGDNDEDDGDLRVLYAIERSDTKILYNADYTAFVVVN